MSPAPLTQSIDLPSYMRSIAFRLRLEAQRGCWNGRPGEAWERYMSRREPEVRIISSNRPRYRFVVTINSDVVAEGRDGDREKAAREARLDFERWAESSGKLIAARTGS